MQYINGLWVEHGSHRFTSTNPATGGELWQGWAAGPAEITAAVSAARAAFAPWSARSVAERHEILSKFKVLVDDQREALAELIAKETGKAWWDARSEVAAVVAKLTYTTEAYEERTGEKSRTTAVGTAMVRHRPHGVLAVYGPYNFPAHLPNGHIMPALLAGNCLIFKPSEQTPTVGEWLMRQWEAAGLPAGVLNLVQGEKDTGVALAQSAVDGILFTGSSATGKLLHEQLAGRPEIILALEMGGNNPLILGPVDDLPAAVHETLLSAFTGTGQRCTCARRLVVIEDTNTEPYLDLLVRSAKSLRVGAFDESPAPFMGPLISMKEAERILQAQQMMVDKGGEVLLEATLLRPGLPFLSPAIIDVTNAVDIPDEEYFGPLLQVYRVAGAQEAVERANATRFGLSAGILCDDAALFQQLSNNLRAGLINWNRQTTGASGAGPFGGIGCSGNHRPAGYYAADYCAYPVASVHAPGLALPPELPPGMVIG